MTDDLLWYIVEYKIKTVFTNCCTEHYNKHVEEYDYLSSIIHYFIYKLLISVPIFNCINIQ